jgi:hypothetical protein
MHNDSLRTPLPSRLRFGIWDKTPKLCGLSRTTSLSFLAMEIIFGVCAGGTWFSGGSVVLPNWGSAGRCVLVDVEEVGES